MGSSGPPLGPDGCVLGVLLDALRAELEHRPRWRRGRGVDGSERANTVRWHGLSLRSARR
ncbi:MAG TPA: hypothetical protein VNL98_12335 [Gemmatimonadales bacterium]|nr:hypothetical protein [Gemmatimonadales bacterium]